MSQSANEPKVEILKDIPRKEEFQKYLEKAGVIDQLTKLLVSLYENPDRPENALDYIKNFLGANVQSANDDSKELHQRIADLENELKGKEEEISQLKQQMSNAQNKEEDNNPDENEVNNDNQE
eukprot:102556_1